MPVHRINADDLEVELRTIVRSGEKIDKLYLDDLGAWVVITEDRIESRPAYPSHATRLGIGGDAA